MTLWAVAGSAGAPHRAMQYMYMVPVTVHLSLSESGRIAAVFRPLLHSTFQTEIDLHQAVPKSCCS